MGKFTNGDDDNTLEDRDGLESGSERSESEVEGLEATETDEADSERDADDTGDNADPAKAVVGLKKRIAKLTAQRNSGRAALQERDALKARVAAYEKRERDEETKRRDAASRTPAAQKEAQERARVQSAIEFGLGDGSVDEWQEMREERQLRKEQYAMQGISYLKSEMEDHGIALTDDQVVRWERAVGSEMAEDTQLHNAFRRPSTQQAAIQEAFKRVRDGLVNPVATQQGGKPLARIERNRQAVLGSPGRGAVEGAPEPEYDPKPPKELKGRALEEWWAADRDKLWKQLQDREANQ